MIDVPVATPVTKPVDATVATLLVLLLHVPPEDASVNVVVPVPNKYAVPVMPAGDAFTLMALVVMLPARVVTSAV